MCNKSKVGRWFWKCSDCLTPVAVDVEITRVVPQCGACGGDMWCMGRVERTRLVRDGERCACDERCTAATGPNCECSCGGENHGTGRTVAVQYDQGGIPTIDTPDTDKCRKVAAEWTAAMAPLRAERDRLARDIESRWVERSIYDRWCELANGCNHAARLKSHVGRIAAARSLVTRLVPC